MQDFANNIKLHDIKYTNQKVCKFKTHKVLNLIRYTLVVTSHENNACSAFVLQAVAARYACPRVSMHARAMQLNKKDTDMEKRTFRVISPPKC